MNQNFYFVFYEQFLSSKLQHRPWVIEKIDVKDFFLLHTTLNFQDFKKSIIAFIIKWK